MDAVKLKSAREAKIGHEKYKAKELFATKGLGQEHCCMLFAARSLSGMKLYTPLIYQKVTASFTVSLRRTQVRSLIYIECI